jgi:hypothetical protein
MNREEASNKRIKKSNPLTPIDRIGHSLELSGLGMSHEELTACVEIFKHTFGESK